MRPVYLVGRRLERVIVSRHLHDAEAPPDPLDVWLIDSNEVATHITTGSDWCLIVEASDPYEGYDMAEHGRIEVGPVSDETPFADHLGETVLVVREEGSDSGRLALEITFPSGRVRCEMRAGDLRLSTG
ncbi:hypothetical protein [Streptomyces sp. NPDC086182]|uniref:hypothetical protein n=1 Tax=Streptomyces sp. NPDC086182 TaxID=3155058 RepID=UPI003440A19D